MCAFVDMDLLKVRQTVYRDIGNIMEIEQKAFASPWDAISMMLAIDSPGCYNLCAYLGDCLAGYCFASAGNDMLHILNLAVRGEYRRKGVASMLIEKMCAFAGIKALDRVFLEVRKGNAGAQSLYTSLGFIHMGIWPAYYSDTGEDACVMGMKIPNKGLNL
ncbi:MAG: ribosomal protein S18-alanine N-acetyltransferase [Thermodesulfobacteriota bacterium]|nr:ribosomal protein S18-alanine N-acetyltransferase [Thermodesulfobacteriota bacterium]